MKRGLVGLSILLSLSLIPAYSATPPKAGSICSKQGITKTYKGKIYKCKKVSGKLVWNKGKVVKQAASVASPTAAPAPTPSPTPTFSPSPSTSTSKGAVPTVSNPTITLLDSFSGKSTEGLCWIANRFKNANESVSPRYVYSRTVVSDKGLIITSGGPTYVPSLAPSAEYWSFQKFFCNEDRIGKLGPGNFSLYNYFTKNEVDRTSPSDMPKVLSLVDKKPESNLMSKGKFEIKVENRSRDKILDRGTLVSIIFFGEDGKPVSGASERLNRSIPPLTVGTLDFPDFDIGNFEIPKFDSYVVSLAQLMCRTDKLYACSY